MLAAILAPFMASALLAAIAVVIGTVLIVAFFMLVDATFARAVLLISSVILVSVKVFGTA